MAHEAFTDKQFRADTLAVISQANTIIEEYHAQGFKLTLRQLYYQFVARALLPNSQRSYKRLGKIVSDARMAGLMDWDMIEDRTRELDSWNQWAGPKAILDAVAKQYHIDLWKGQKWRFEVWIEKQALVGVIEDLCRELDIAWFACRGYVSMSEQYVAGKRMAKYLDAGLAPVILHLGDHDPSGIDMTRDNRAHLEDFTYWRGIEVRRIALNRDQVDEYNPPPNPAKFTDSRIGGYVALHGYESWELDALDPTVIQQVIRDEVEEAIDAEPWQERVDLEAEQKAVMQDVATRFDEVAKWLEGDDYDDE